MLNSVFFVSTFHEFVRNCFSKCQFVSYYIPSFMSICGFRGFDGWTMTFLSQSFSSETLLRGMDLSYDLSRHSCLSVGSDASPEELMAELQRLEDSQTVSAFLVQWWSFLYLGISWISKWFHLSGFVYTMFVYN